jgi:hypothetical protein
MTRYAKRKLKYSLNEIFNFLPYVEWDRFVQWIVNIRIVNPQGVVSLGLKPSGKKPPSG